MLNPAILTAALQGPLARAGLAHFPLPGLLLLASLPAASLAAGWHDPALLPRLPWLLAALGIALCAAFRRWRQLLLLLWILVLYGGLLPDVQAIRHQLPPTPRMRADFILAATLWPLLCCIFALWPERGRLGPELAGRGLVLALVVGGLLWLRQHPATPLLERLGQTWWPSLHPAWMSLPQLSYPLCALGLMLLGLQYRLEPRPQHAVACLLLPASLSLLPYIFTHPHLLPAFAVMALLSLGAALVQESLDLAYRDELTGLPSRRALNEKLQRLGRDYCLAVIDIDHFKQCNDRHGHDVGDQVLRLVASRLRSGSRRRAYRQGGEEFVIVLERCDPAAALDLLETIREDIAGYPMQLRDRDRRASRHRKGRQQRGRAAVTGRLSVTISIGLAAGRRPEPVAAVLKRADQALYKAKSEGRNRTVQA